MTRQAVAKKKVVLEAENKPKLVNNESTEQFLKDCSTAFPTPQLNSTLHFLAREAAKKSLVEYLLCCEKNLNINIGYLVEKANAVDTSKRFAPALYHATYMLQESIKSGNLTNIMDAIQVTARLMEKDFYAKPGFTISSVLSEDWEAPYIEELRAYDQVNIRGEKTLVRPILEKEALEFHKKNIEECIALIKQYDPELYAEMEEFVTDIKIFQGRVLRGDTSASTFGSMWLRIPEPEDDQVGYWIEHVVHEVSHLRLEAHFFCENLVLNSFEEKKFKAPIRDDLRPMRGIFHACFVLARMMRVFRRISIAGYDKRFRDRLQLCRLQLDIGLESVHHPEAKLTENGRLIRESFAKCSVS